MFNVEQQVLELMNQSDRIFLYLFYNFDFHLNFHWLVVDRLNLILKLNLQDSVRNYVVYQYDDVNQLYVEMHVNICGIEMVYNQYVFDCVLLNLMIEKMLYHIQCIYVVFRLKVQSKKKLFKDTLIVP